MPPLKGSPSGFLGRHHTEETKRMISEKKKGKAMSKAHRDAIRKGHSVAVYSPKTEEHKRKISISVSRYLLSTKRFHSNLECRGRKLLSKFGLSHWVRLDNHVFDGGSKELKMVVEIDGCYWHSHGCNLPSSGKLTNDIRRPILAKKYGYKLLILRECEESQWTEQLRMFI